MTATPRITIDVQAIEHAVNALADDGQTIELRIPKVDGRATRTVSGYFTDIRRLAQEAAKWDGRADGIYVTLNPVNPALLARAANRTKDYATTTTSDSDIERRRRLPFDFDPKRPAGISSTDAEHDAAIQRAADCRAWLSSLGWPDPIEADSGNGAHLLYRIDLPNDSESADLIQRCVEAIAVYFADAVIDVDRTVFNASRVWKLYGTKAGKGDSIPDRPHRVSKILVAPADLLPVSPELLKALAEHAGSGKAETPRTSGAFDVGAWLKQHNIAVASKGDWKGAYRWVLASCPFSDAHTDGACVLQFPSGAIAASCRHNTCSGKGWSDLREIAGDPAAPKDPADGLTKNGTPLGSDRKKTPQAASAPIESKPDLYDLGLAFAKRYGKHTTYNEDTAAWSIYTTTHWQELSRGTTQLRDMATDVIRDSGQPVSSINKVEGVIQMAASHCKRTLHPHPNLVNFQNGTLDLETMTLRAHSPADGLTSCLPYDYRPGPHPMIDKLLRQTAPDPFARDAFAALVGAALMRDYRLQNAGLLLGPLRSGKSTLRQVANLVSGNDRYACAGPELFGRELEGMRSRAAHNNQSLVTLEELPVEALRNEEVFKAMVAHGGAAMRRLHQPEITNNQWRPKLLMVTNEAPRYSDRSGALTDRLIIINCPNSRPEGERDLYLLDKLLPEIGAFAVTCLQKAKDALAAGHYPQSTGMRAARDEIERNGDALKSFVSEECVIEDSAWIDTANLYQTYRTYCDENGQKAMSKARFTQALGEKFRTVVPKSQRMQKPTGGTTLGSVWTRGIQGIRLRTPIDPEPDETATPATPALHLNGVSCSGNSEHSNASNSLLATPATAESIFVSVKVDEEQETAVTALLHHEAREREKTFSDSGVAGVALNQQSATQSHEPALHLNGVSCSTGVAEVLQVYPTSQQPTVACTCGGRRTWNGDHWRCAGCMPHVDKVPT